MALGGGSWVTQSKVMPGAYINFISAERADASLSDRGVAALALALDWGDTGGVIELHRGEFDTMALRLLGYRSIDEQMKPVREVLKNAKTLYLCRLGGGEKAENTLATAKYPGVRGNELTVIVRQNADDRTRFDVVTMLAGEEVDSQTAADTDALAANDFLDWKAGETLAESAGMPLTGGTNPGTVAGADYQKALMRLEPYGFNTLGCLSTEQSVKDIFTAFTKRMREDEGVKFQTVLYRANADYEGIISVSNKAVGDGVAESALVPWVLGAQAGCEVNRDLTNRKYDGEYLVDVDYTQSALEKGVRAGQLMLHRVGSEVRLLRDVNTLVSFTAQKGEDFASNQTLRVLDQIGNDIAALFNKRFLGIMPNDADGRISLWSAIVAHHRALERLRAIEDFSPDDVKVEKGDSKRAVVVTDLVTPVNAMQQLYMTVIVA